MGEPYTLQPPFLYIDPTPMKTFAPIECNPDVFNDYLGALQVTNYQFADVYGLDEELLQFVPRPVRAILLVFPISKRYEQYREQADKSQTSDSTANWSAQTISNSCGTMALIHALANGVPQDSLGSGFGNELITQFNKLPAQARPEYLENSKELEQVHQKVANAGDTEVPADLDSVESHYVCITKHGNELVELDGRRKGPVVRANGIEEVDILQVPQTIEIIKEFINREEGSNQFSILALTDA